MQTKLLDLEIKNKRKEIDRLSNISITTFLNLKSKISRLDALCLKYFISRNNQKYVEQIQSIHNRKLTNIGASSHLKSCDPDTVITNLSSYTLSHREKFLLSFGLEFSIPLYKAKFINHFLPFEQLICNLKNLQIQPDTDFSNAIDTVKQCAQSSFSKLKKHQQFSPIFKKDDLDILKNLSKNPALIISRPDKGRGIVIMNKTDYINKMNHILSDQTKFKKIDNTTPFKQCLRNDDKICRLLRKLLDNGAINQGQYNSLYPTGSSPGIMYGLPKIHKPNAPLRPILAAYNTPTYSISKFLIPLLQDCTINQYTLQNSYDFFHSITDFTSNKPFFLASFDVTSLFTNIPVDETIDIVCNQIFQTVNLHNGLTLKEFKDLLTVACKESFFLFDNCAYQQCDGVQMGSPLGPTLANSFLCHFETSWLNNCPPEFKPIYYKRYVDDTFIIFEDQSHAPAFLNYLNSQHCNINFTMETEQNNSLSFLDLQITRDSNNKICTSIFRKNTFSGLGMSFFSHTPSKFKINNICTLLYRAYHLSSSYLSFNTEIEFLRNFFSNNGYPSNIFETQCRKFLNKIFVKSTQILTAERKKMYISLPYYGHESEKLYSTLIASLSEYYPQVRFILSLKNNFSIGSLFRFKDLVPPEMRSDIIYKFTCDSCQASYVGSTRRRCKERIDQHLGVSSRTGRPLSTLLHSIPRKHAEDHNHPFHRNNFKIINQTNASQNLLILESLHIHFFKPSLNIQQTATPLFTAPTIPRTNQSDTHPTNS
jgi:hypothetical protein